VATSRVINQTFISYNCYYYINDIITIKDRSTTYTNKQFHIINKPTFTLYTGQVGTDLIN